MIAKTRHFLLASLLLVPIIRPLAAETPLQRLDADGHPLTAINRPWACVLDRRTGLIWEVKTDDGGLHDAHRTFAWQGPANDGVPSTHCPTPPCDAQALLDSVNRAGWCGHHHWRLPTREELRALVDYNRPAPGRLSDPAFFPRTQPGFYWSSDTAAADPSEAWGIGFTFGFDYAYFKTDRVFIRLVHAAVAP